MTEEKKPSSLADNLTGGKKYESTPKGNELPTQNQDPEKAKAEMEKLKKKLSEFSKKVLKKFSFTKALAVLPASASPLFEEDEALPKEIIQTKPLHLIMIIPEDKFKEITKIKNEVVQLVKESKENLWIHIKTAEVDLWNYGLDSKYEFLDAISASYPLHDTGILGALRVANIHKSLVLNWLNTGRVRYVATYAIGGSLVRGTADKTSDVDTFVIIDDTDVKRMSRVELLDKLRRRITYDFIKEATALAGVKNILNVQVYLLTDFWQSVKDAQPVMFTFIRDGVPLYDKGTFIPWKRLLQMGRIKPSPEAIDLYMKEGDRTEEIIKRRMLDAMVDIYFGVVTPTQAMMMLAGHAPPVPKTIVKEVEDVLVKKEKVMGKEELKVLEKVVKLYKDYEHGTLKEIPGKEIDILLKESKDYTKKMKELREKLEQKMRQHQADKTHEETFNLMKKVLGDKNQEALIKDMEKELIKKGKLKERMLSIAKEVSNLKKKSKDKKFSTTEMQKIVGDASELNDALTEYSQRKDLVNIAKSVIQVSYGNDKKAEIVLTHEGAFIADQSGKLWRIDKSSFKESNREELESALKETKKTEKPVLTNELLEALKKQLGDFRIAL